MLGDVGTVFKGMPEIQMEKKLHYKWGRMIWAYLSWLPHSSTPAFSLTLSNPSHCSKTQSSSLFFPFRFWHQGEPSGLDEHCVILNIRLRQWGWNDARCDNLQRSICKMMKIFLWMEHSPWTYGWISIHH